MGEFQTIRLQHQRNQDRRTAVVRARPDGRLQEGYPRGIYIQKSDFREGNRRWKREATLAAVAIPAWQNSNDSLWRKFPIKMFA